MFGEFGQSHWSRRTWLIVAAVVGYQVSQLVLTSIDKLFGLPNNPHHIDLSEKPHTEFAIKQLINLVTIVWGTVVFFCCCLLTEYLDFVLFKHILPQSLKNCKNADSISKFKTLCPKEYSIWLFEGPFELIYQSTKKFVPYERLPERKILPPLPEKDFWEMVPWVLRNILFMGISLSVSYHVFNSVHLKKQSFFESFGLFFLQIVIADWAFFAFHYWMHVDKMFYKYAHEDHHSTFGTRGVSALYNQWVDGLLEGAIPYLMAVWITKTGCMYLIMAHNAYEFFFSCDYVDHFDDHQFQYCVYSLRVQFFALVLC
jgi:sterol desaturase/sphingolipid hydroxylase (fatty acid hydroxylase superfamily)